MSGTLPDGIGVVVGILIRDPTTREAILVDAAEAVSGRGLKGDKRMKARPGGKRQVTVIRSEDLDAASSTLSRPVTHALTRRNLVVKGVSLDDLMSGTIAIDDVTLEGKGACDPCEKMNDAFGDGGERALHNRGGAVMAVTTSGTIRVGATVRVRHPGT